MASELGVQTIQHTNGTDALTVGSDGVVTAAEYVKQSGVPAFHVTHFTASGSSYITGHLDFNTVEVNQGSHWNSTDDYFEAPVDGLYQFNFSGLFSTTGGNVIPAATSVHVYLESSSDSGTTWDIRATQYGYVTSSTSYLPASFSSMIDLTSGDRVRLYAANLGIYVHSNVNPKYAPKFSGYLIG